MSYDRHKKNYGRDDDFERKKRNERKKLKEFLHYDEEEALNNYDLEEDPYDLDDDQY